MIVLNKRGWKHKCDCGANIIVESSDTYSMWLPSEPVPRIEQKLYLLWNCPICNGINKFIASKSTEVTIE